VNFDKICKFRQRGSCTVKAELEETWLNQIVFNKVWEQVLYKSGYIYTHYGYVLNQMQGKKLK